MITINRKNKIASLSSMIASVGFYAVSMDLATVTGSNIHAINSGLLLSGLFFLLSYGFSKNRIWLQNERVGILGIIAVLITVVLSICGAGALVEMAKGMSNVSEWFSYMIVMEIATVTVIMLRVLGTKIK